VCGGGVIFKKQRRNIFASISALSDCTRCGTPQAADRRPDEHPQVQKLAAASTDPLKSEYVIVAGVQVHGPLGQNFVWPGAGGCA
jgi:hypothetical protein